MATIVPPTYHEVNHFYDGEYDSDDGLASDQEWASEIEEEIITISLSRNMDTSLLATSPKSRPAELPGRPSPGRSGANEALNGTSPKQASKEQARNPTGEDDDDLDDPSEEDEGDQPSDGDDEDPDQANAAAGPSSQRLDQAQQDQDDQEEVPLAHTCSIIGLNTTTPYLKVNNQVFKGKVVELIGSELIWEMKDTRDATPLPLMPSLQTIHFQPRLYEPARADGRGRDRDDSSPEPDYLQPLYLNKRGKTTCFSSDDDLSPSVFSEGGTTKVRNPNSTRPKGRPPGIKNSYVSRRARSTHKPRGRPKGMPRSGPGSRGGKIPTRASRGPGRPRKIQSEDDVEEDDQQDDDSDGDSSVRPQAEKKKAGPKPSAKEKGKGKAKIAHWDETEEDDQSDGWQGDGRDNDDDDDDMRGSTVGLVGSGATSAVASPAPGPSRPRRQAAVQRRVVIDQPPESMDVDGHETVTDVPEGVVPMNWDSD